MIILRFDCPDRLPASYDNAAVFPERGDVVIIAGETAKRAVNLVTIDYNEPVTVAASVSAPMMV